MPSDLCLLEISEFTPTIPKVCTQWTFSSFEERRLLRFWAYEQATHTIRCPPSILSIFLRKTDKLMVIYILVVSPYRQLFPHYSVVDINTLKGTLFWIAPILLFGYQKGQNIFYVNLLVELLKVVQSLFHIDHQLLKHFSWQTSSRGSHRLFHLTITVYNSWRLKNLVYFKVN